MFLTNIDDEKTWCSMRFLLEYFASLNLIACLFFEEHDFLIKKS